MALAWLLLFLGSWVRLLTILGLDFQHGATVLAMAPLGLVAIHLFLPKALKAPDRPPLRWALASLTGLLSLAFVRLTLLKFWDPAEWLPAILLVLAGLGIAMFAGEEGPADRGPGPWFWVSLWMLLSSRDPVLGLLGAGLAPLVFPWGKAPGAAGSGPDGSRPMSWVLPLLLGLFLPRPWWDWGLHPSAALTVAALGLGGGLAALASSTSFGARLRRLPDWLLLGGLGMVGLLYSPSWGLIWGLLMGILAGCAFARPQRPLRIGAVAGYWILGLLLSFTLQANAWLPGLRHFIWLGN
ncbi:MAG: hypothetical protein IPQ13_02080 [Holophagaceae bacterium]|nr:hypothetical protein [Holophagaceae bacterium]